MMYLEGVLQNIPWLVTCTALQLHIYELRCIILVAHSSITSLCPYSTRSLKCERKFIPKRKSFPSQISMGPSTESLQLAMLIELALITGTGIEPLAVLPSRLPPHQLRRG